jgi:pyruvate-ferredoxin/flavodoxin oxidoreductase
MKVLRPAITLVAEPAWEAPVSPWLQLAAARSGRGAPSFGYDADAGLTWAECFDLSGNPQPEAPWPVRETRITNAAGEEQTIVEAFTFAHAAALDPAYRSHFRVIPTEAWNEDQLEIFDYLAAGADEGKHKVPYIWIVGRNGELARAVMTQAMIFACRDRRRAWRILQELGGADNEYARRAAEAARQQTLAEADEARQELEAAHSEAVEQARATAAGEAMERLVSVLMNEDALAAMAGSAGIAPASAPAAQPAAGETVEEVVEEEEEEEEEETISFADPYITSALCTTCNECTNLNKRMFQYNANKQATIADAKAGTFAELVQAAVKCPARCIHPGAPRDDDDTATEDLIAKAAQFN